MHPENSTTPAFRTSSAHHIIVEVSDDPHTRKALEVVCFERKFTYAWVKHKDPLIHPERGHIFCKITHTDPVQLFWLGAAFQSLLNQTTI